MDNRESEEQYRQLEQEAAESVAQAVESIAAKYGWKPADVLDVAVSKLKVYYENNHEPVGEDIERLRHLAGIK